ncbi:hypothetical protein [Bizionia sp.]|uniref:hypothetical protein n=1 Tax=Bizionia sp. TaxID=1954480 RepID=UPI003A933F9B
MKIASIIILTGISLCASICCPGEDDYLYSNTNVRNDTVIQIENNTIDFQVNDTIYISTMLNNEQVSVNNNTVLLTDYILLNSQENFYFYNLNLYKETAYDTYALIELNENALIVLEGITTVDYQSLFVRCNLDNTIFRNKFGIKLLEPGKYYLSGSHNYYNEGEELVHISTNSYNNDHISISSKIMASDTTGRYYFTVN